MPTIKLLNHQADFLASDAADVLLLGGIGSGKSEGGAFFALDMISVYPQTPGMIVAPTYQQLIKASVKAVQNQFKRYKIRHRSILSGADKRIEIPGREPIHLFSLQDPDNFRGPEAGWLWSDESSFSSEYGLKVAYGRIRHPKGPLFKRHTSSPNGYNHMYDKFENMDGERATSKIRLIRAKTKDNIFLPPGYYEDLLEDYGGLDNPLARQELNGEFTNLQDGAIYWSFNRDIHVQPCKLDERFPVYAGQDFNFSNMAGCYVQYRDGTFYVTKENVLNYHGADTDSAASKIVKDLVPKYSVSVIPDSTGKSNRTSARGRTDLEIITSYGLNIPRGVRNPFIRDRQNTLNNHMKKNKLFIDPSCKELIKELGTLSARDKEGDKAHVSVSLGYVTWYVAPLERSRKSTFR